MVKKSILYSVVLSALIAMGQPAQAATPYYLSADQLFVKQGTTGTFTCGYVGMAWLSGTLSGEAFYTNRSKVKDLARKVKRATGATRTKLEKKLVALKIKTSRGDTACKAGPSVATPTPTPSSSANFDSNGNVTDAGKALFLIPTELSGNITAGKASYTSLCAGCHSEYTNRSFVNLRSKTSESPMSFTQNDLPDATLANITAYLNRFRQ